MKQEIKEEVYPQLLDCSGEDIQDIKREWEHKSRSGSPLIKEEIDFEIVPFLVKEEMSS